MTLFPRSGGDGRGPGTEGALSALDRRLTALGSLEVPGDTVERGWALLRVEMEDNFLHRLEPKSVARELPQVANGVCNRNAEERDEIVETPSGSAFALRANGGAPCVVVGAAGTGA